MIVGVIPTYAGQTPRLAVSATGNDYAKSNLHAIAQRCSFVPSACSLRSFSIPVHGHNLSYRVVLYHNSVSYIHKNAKNFGSTVCDGSPRPCPQNCRSAMRKRNSGTFTKRYPSVLVSLFFHIITFYYNNGKTTFFLLLLHLEFSQVLPLDEYRRSAVATRQDGIWGPGPFIPSLFTSIDTSSSARSSRHSSPFKFQSLFYFLF